MKLLTTSRKLLRRDDNLKKLFGIGPVRLETHHVSAGVYSVDSKGTGLGRNTLAYYFRSEDAGSGDR